MPGTFLRASTETPARVSDLVGFFRCGQGSCPAGERYRVPLRSACRGLASRRESPALPLPITPPPSLPEGAENEQQQLPGVVQPPRARNEQSSVHKNHQVPRSEGQFAGVVVLEVDRACAGAVAFVWEGGHPEPGEPVDELTGFECLCHRV